MPRLTKDNVELGLGVTVLGYSDSHSYTVVKISENKSKVTLQRDKAVRITKPEFIPGGFSAVCINNADIKYENHSRSQRRTKRRLLQKERRVLV